MPKRKKLPANNFKKAVLATVEIKDCYKDGLGALGKNSLKINLTHPCQGSVDIDNCVRAKYPNASRWDYTIGHNSQVHFVEVHPASTSDVEIVVKKLNWLKEWLSSSAPELHKIKAQTNAFIWVMTGRFSIPKTSSQYRRISENGLILVSAAKFT